MLNAKINVNGIEWLLTGDREDIVYALRNTTSSTIIPNEKEIIRKVPMTTLYKSLSVPTEKGTAKFSKEDTIRMYQYLASQSDYTIKQFEITRGGKTNPMQYTVCLIFDNARQRYCYYNPKTEDRFLQSFSINDVVARINANESGFSMLHTVANKIWEKISIVDDLIRITPNASPFMDSDGFRNHEVKKAQRGRAKDGRFIKTIPANKI